MILQEGEIDLLQRVARKTLGEKNGGPQKKSLIDSIKDEESLPLIWRELGEAVNLLNRYVAGEQIQSTDPVDLHYADDMRAAMIKHNISYLPNPEEILSLARNDSSSKFIKKLIRVFRKTKDYGFLTKFETRKALIGEALAIYGKMFLELRPDLIEEGVFGASTLEEMLAVMRFKGIKTEAFEVSRDWFIEEEEENPGVDGKGFSHSLVAKVRGTPV